MLFNYFIRHSSDGLLDVLSLLLFALLLLPSAGGTTVGFINLTHGQISSDGYLDNCDRKLFLKGSGKKKNVRLHAHEMENTNQKKKKGLGSAQAAPASTASNAPVKTYFNTCMFEWAKSQTLLDANAHKGTMTRAVRHLARLLSDHGFICTAAIHKDNTKSQNLAKRTHLFRLLCVNNDNCPVESDSHNVYIVLPPRAKDPQRK